MALVTPAGDAEPMAAGGQQDRRRSVLAAALVGAALMAAVDEIVFHQVLGWHHFYDRGTSRVGLVSDGLLHAAELVALVGGGFLLADLHRRTALVRRAAWGGLLLGAGAFQLLDGLLHHKVLRLHQVRYDVDLLPYDVAWNLAGVVLLAAGALVVTTGRHAPAPAGPHAGG